MHHKFLPEQWEAMRDGLVLFDQEKYWECHEALEDLWMEERGQARYIYWAIIQLATSLFHWREGNLAGARGMLAKTKEKIKKCEELLWIDASIRQKLHWDDLLTLIAAVDERSASLEDFQALSEFKFGRGP